ncbi:hypothetical protein ACIBKY_51545 [Nonomuraea sp. NPDC050394]|uniref:hypothetical protein n=1 Tax=Nonomuraea sp. NPDC050394 TaxID=3364363 RepID=UPI0037AF7F51
MRDHLNLVLRLDDDPTTIRSLWATYDDTAPDRITLTEMREDAGEVVIAVCPRVTLSRIHRGYAEHAGLKLQASASHLGRLLVVLPDDDRLWWTDQAALGGFVDGTFDRVPSGGESEHLLRRARQVFFGEERV